MESCNMNGGALPQRKKISTSSVVLIVLGGFMAAFIIAMTTIYCVKGSTPDTLIQCVMGGGSFEALLTAGIRISKVIAGGSGQKLNAGYQTGETEETGNG